MPGLPKVHVSILETITWKQEQIAANIRSSNEVFFITKIKRTLMMVMIQKCLFCSIEKIT